MGDLGGADEGGKASWDPRAYRRRSRHYQWSSLEAEGQKRCHIETMTEGFEEVTDNVRNLVSTMCGEITTNNSSTEDEVFSWMRAVLMENKTAGETKSLEKTNSKGGGNDPPTAPSSPPGPNGFPSQEARTAAYRRQGVPKPGPQYRTHH